MKISEIASWATVGTLFFGGLYAFGNDSGYRPILKREFQTVQMQLDELSRAQLYQRFWVLSEKKKREPLTTDELLDMCRIASALEFKIVIPECK